MKIFSFIAAAKAASLHFHPSAAGSAQTVRACPRRLSQRGVGLGAVALFTAIPAFALEKELPPLQPPLPLMKPAFWENYGSLTVAVALFVAVMVLWILIKAFEKTPAPVETAAEEARQVLRHLGARPRDTSTASEASRAMRRYLRLTLKLPSGEMTTAEIRQALRNQRELASSPASRLESFFQGCDEWSFSANPPAASFDPVATASALMEEIEAGLASKPPVPAAFQNSGEVAG